MVEIIAFFVGYILGAATALAVAYHYWRIEQEGDKHG